MSKLCRSVGLSQNLKMEEMQMKACISNIELSQDRLIIDQIHHQQAFSLIKGLITNKNKGLFLDCYQVLVKIQTFWLIDGQRTFQSCLFVNQTILGHISALSQWKQKTSLAYVINITQQIMMYNSTFYLLITFQPSSINLCPPLVENTLHRATQTQITPLESQPEVIVQNHRPETQAQKNRPQSKRYQGILRRNNHDDDEYVEQKREYRKKRYEIKRVFCCSAEGCEKRYGSLIAQRNHQRNIHGIRRRAEKQQA